MQPLPLLSSTCSLKGPLLDPSAEWPPRGSALKHSNLEHGWFVRLALWDKHSVLSVRHTCGTKNTLGNRNWKASPVFAVRKNYRTEF